MAFSFFFSSRRRHTRCLSDWSSDVCSSDLPSGWVVVRDALTLGPSHGPDTVTPHTRPPADDDAEHVFVRVAECFGGHVEIEVTCEPVFDYGRSEERRVGKEGRGQRWGDAEQ